MGLVRGRVPGAAEGRPASRSNYRVRCPRLAASLDAVLNHLGDTYHATGDITRARDAWQQALDIVGQLGAVPGASRPYGYPYGYPDGYPKADEIDAKLHRLSD